MKRFLVFPDPNAPEPQPKKKKLPALKYSDVYTHSDSDLDGITPISQESNQTLETKPQEGNFVIVIYEGEYFPGVVKEVSGECYKVNTICVLVV